METLDVGRVKLYGYLDGIVGVEGAHVKQPTYMPMPETLSHESTVAVLYENMRLVLLKRDADQMLWESLGEDRLRRGGVHWAKTLIEISEDEENGLPEVTLYEA